MRHLIVRMEIDIALYDDEGEMTDRLILGRIRRARRELVTELVDLVEIEPRVTLEVL